MDQLNLTANAFALEAGIDPSNFAKMIDGKQRVSQKTVNKIAARFSVSPDWLLTGEGEMTVERQDVPVKTDKLESVPLIPLGACAGAFGDYLPEGVEARRCDKVVAPVPGCDLAIDVTGDSMEPDFPDGCRVFLRKINDTAFIAWGSVFVLDTENGPFIKKIFPGEGGSIVAKSINQEYPPFTIPMSSVRGIYRVLMMARGYSAM